MVRKRSENIITINSHQLAVTEKPPSSILLSNHPFLPITEAPGNARLHLEGVLFKKEEFDEQGEKAAKSLRTWAQFNVVLEGNQVTFSTYNASSQHNANQRTGKVGDDALSSVPRSMQGGLITTGSLINLKNFIGGGVGESPLALTKHLRAVLAAPEEDLAAALEVLCREGLLARLTGSGGYGDYSEVLIGEGYSEDEAAILRDYPLRKGESMAKLEAMKVYAAATSEQRRFLLDDYFRR